MIICTQSRIFMFLLSMQNTIETVAIYIFINTKIFTDLSCIHVVANIHPSEYIFLYPKSLLFPKILLTFLYIPIYYKRYTLYSLYF